MFLLSQKHFGKLSPLEERGNSFLGLFPGEEGGERGYCLPLAEQLTCRVMVRRKGNVRDNCM